jgi:hypothetical protein
VKPGDAFLLAIEATDSYGQTVSTEPRRVSIISNEELIGRLHSRLAAVIERLAETLRMQRDALDATQKLRGQWRQSTAGSTALQELSTLQNRQRQIEEAIGGSTGATVELRAIQEAMAVNRTAEQRLELKLAGMLDQLEGLSAQALPEVDLQLAEALQSARQEIEPAAEAGMTLSGQPPMAALAAASHEQLTVVRVLESVVGELAELDNLGRIAAQLRQLGQQQADLINQTREQHHASLAAPGERSADAQAGQLAEHQSRLAQTIDKLQLRLEALAGSRPQSEGQEPLQAAARAAQRLAMGSQMRFAAEQLLRREWGQALTTEVAVAEGLQRLEQALTPADAANQSQPDWPEALASGIAALESRQQQVLNTMEEMHLAGDAGRPARGDRSLAAASAEQRSLADDTRQLREKARAAPTVDFALQEAADAMQSAGERLSRGQLDQARKDATQAQVRLSLLLKALGPSIESSAQTQANGAESQSNSHRAGLGAELQVLKAMQEELNQRTQAAASGNAPQSETAALARQQGRLADLTQDLLTRLSQQPQSEPNRP